MGWMAPASGIAICPKKGKGAGLVMPWCDTPAMVAHLAEISAAIDPGAHAVLMLDQAGWHMSAKLTVPGNITLLPLPPRSPELNPVENVWHFMRDNWLSNRVFKGYDDIVAHCCDAWNNLADRPWKIMSIGMRQWAHGCGSAQVGIRPCISRRCQKRKRVCAASQKSRTLIVKKLEEFSRQRRALVSAEPAQRESRSRATKSVDRELSCHSN